MEAAVVGAVDGGGVCLLSRLWVRGRAVALVEPVPVPVPMPAPVPSLWPRLLRVVPTQVTAVARNVDKSGRDTHQSPCVAAVAGMPLPWLWRQTTSAATAPQALPAAAHYTHTHTTQAVPQRGARIPKLA